MKKIELINMKIRNFKGFKEFELKADGNDLVVSGENGTRKTSLFDAFTWAIFGKNSQFLSDFKFMPLDENNEAIEHLETEVSLELSVAGKPLSFSRMAKNGSGKAKGYTSTYRVDGVKMLQKDYNKKIADIIDEETFKQITSIYYVAEKMDKKARRALLFDLVGDLTDLEVIESNKDLAPLIEILGSHSVDDKRSLLMEERPKNKQEQKEADVRIDEADRNSVDVSTLNKEELNKKKVSSELQIEELQTKISSIKNGSEKTNKLSEIQTKKAELETLRSQHLVKQNSKVDGLQKGKQETYEKAMDAQNNFIDKENELKQEVQKIEEVKKDIASTERSIQELRDDYTTLASEVFLEFDEHQATCQYCGQELQEDKKEEVREKYEKERIDFNTKKSISLEAINNNGKSLSGSLVDKKEELESLTKSLASLEEEKRALEAKRDQEKEEYVLIQKTIKDLQDKATPFENTKTYKEKIAEIDNLTAAVDSMDNSVKEDVEAIQNKINEIKTVINRINEDLYQFVLATKQDERKLELIEQQKKLAIRGGEIERQILMLNEFVKAKVSLLTDKINAEFKLVTFKLFEVKNNGSLEEVCEPLLDGINFSDASNGERMRAGLDIINTLTRLKAVSAPVFIDNAEGLTKETDVNYQLIKLNAVKGQKELKIETKTLGDK